MINYWVEPIKSNIKIFRLEAMNLRVSLQQNEGKNALRGVEAKMLFILAY